MPPSSLYTFRATAFQPVPFSPKVSEYSKPWHNIDPSEWANLEARMRMVISSHQNNPRHRRRVNALRMQLPVPSPEMKMDGDLAEYLTT